MSNANMPGHYHADGDPPGTVRYWDGTQWSGDPIPAPPGSPGMASPVDADNSRYAGVGVRIGANVIDFFINLGVTLALVAFLSSDNSVNVDLISGVIITLATFGIYTAILAQYGGTPGKLIVGLRVTNASGTSPLTFSVAARRNSPFLSTIIPFLGLVVMLVVFIVSIVYVSNDDERRSVFDRVGETRVVYKNRL